MVRGGFWCFVIEEALLLTLYCQCGSHEKTIVKTTVLMSINGSRAVYVGLTQSKLQCCPVQHFGSMIGFK